MILRHVGQNADIRLNISQFFKIYRMRADFGDHDVTALCSHLEEQFVKLIGIGSGKTLPNLFAANKMTFRADNSRFVSSKFKHLAKIVRCRSFSVRADNGHEFHIVKRSQKLVFTHLRIRFSCVCHKHVFDVFVARLFVRERDKRRFDL